MGSTKACAASVPVTALAGGWWRGLSWAGQRLTSWFPCKECGPAQPRAPGVVPAVWATGEFTLELETNLREVRSFTITEKAPTRAFS